MVLSGFPFKGRVAFIGLPLQGDCLYPVGGWFRQGEGRCNEAGRFGFGGRFGKGGGSLRKSGAGRHVPYDKALTEKARENRRRPAPAENRLWFEALRGGRLSGLKFTRQKPLDGYIVDFYCAELMLAIEIDGDSHDGRGRYDEARTRRLNALGVEVVRYANAEVMNQIEGVRADLQKRVSDMRTR